MAGDNPGEAFQMVATEEGHIQKLGSPLRLQMYREVTDFHFNSDSSECGSTPARLESEETEILGKSLTNTISSVMKLPALEWNLHSQKVYEALKVEQYIVKQNYFLSASLQGAARKAFNMDVIFRYISTQPHIQSWSVLEKKIDNLLEIYDIDGVQDLAGTLCDDPDASLENMALIRQNIYNLLRRSGHFTSDNLHDASEVFNVLGDLMIKCRSNSICEEDSRNYVIMLINFMILTMPEFHLNCRQGAECSLTLQGKKRTVKPDVLVKGCGGTVLLVGKFKQFQMSNAESEMPIEESLAKNNDTKDRKRKLVNDRAFGEANKQDSTKRKAVIGLSTKGEGKTADSVQDRPSSCNRKDIEETKDASDVAIDEEDSSERKPVSGISPTGEEKTADSDHSKPSGSDRKNIEENDEDSDNAIDQDSEEGCCYRRLKMSEYKRVGHYLPKLLAGMLAVMQKKEEQSVSSMIKDPELLYDEPGRVQLGFAVEGFRLRFVRLILAEKGAGKTSVADLKKPNVKCCVFLTKELNLFHKVHLKLFYRFLYGLMFNYQYT